MFGQLVGPDIAEMIRNKQFVALRRALTSISSDSVAEILVDVPGQELAVLFRILPRPLAADIFEYLPVDKQEELLRSLGQEQVANVLNDMAPDDRTTLLEELPGTVTQRLIAMLSPEERRIATSLLGYPPQSVGRRMTPDYIAVQEEMTCGDVIEHVRRVGRDKETLNVLYIVDETGHLVDDIRLREVILADPGTRLRNIIDRAFTALRADQDQEEAVREFQRLDRTALPVVDSAGMLVGIVTVDDVMDVAEQEVTEDIQKIGGMEALDAPYWGTRLTSMIRKRGGWLSALFIGEMLTATAMGHFEGEIARAVVLAVFVPLIISSGGNSGSQAATLVVRALATQDVKLREWLRVLFRELTTGFALGAWLGLIGFLRVTLWQHLGFFDYGPHYLLLATTVWVSLVGVVCFGTLTGSMLPFLLRRLGFDPATSSAPFVATLVDVTGLLIYFTAAAIMLRGTLL